MSKRNSIILIVILVAALTSLTTPGLWHCAVYYMTIASKPEVLAALSVKPVNITLPQSKDANGLSLGYAQTNIKPESVKKIKLVGSAMIIECNDCSFAFVPPSNNEKVNDANSVDRKHNKLSKGEQRLQEITADFFNAETIPLNILPKKYSEIFTMSSDECGEYLILTMLKYLQYCQETAIELFENDNIKGVIRSGFKKSPSRINISVFSSKTKDSSPSQGIKIIPKSAEKSREIAYNFLSTYKFLLSEIPKESDLRQLIISTLKDNPRFTYDPNE